MTNQSHFNLCLSQNQNYCQKSNLNSLIKTQPSSKHPHSNPVSLLTCSSSISISTSTQGLQYEIKIFGQYLLEISQNKRKNLQSLMQNHYSSMETFNSAPINVLFPKISSQNAQSFQKLQKPMYFYHFIGAWILSMGFQDKQTKKYVLSKIYNNSKSKSQQIAFYQKFYQNLGCETLNESQRFRFLIKLCSNGWEFFVLQLISIGRKLNNQKQKTKNVA